MGLCGAHEVPRHIDPVQPTLFSFQIKKSPTTEPIVAKVKGLREYYISLVVTILLQNLMDLGQLLSICGLTGLLRPSLPDNVSQIFKAVVNGWSLATLLTTRTVDRMFPMDSLRGLSTTTRYDWLIRQGRRSARASTTRCLVRLMAPRRYQLALVTWGASQNRDQLLTALGPSELVTSRLATFLHVFQ